jgi:hypothetical protein
MVHLVDVLVDMAAQSGRHSDRQTVTEHLDFRTTELSVKERRREACDDRHVLLAARQVALCPRTESNKERAVNTPERSTVRFSYPE